MKTLQTEKPSEVILNLNIQQATAINELLATGFWGTSAAQCAMRLLDESLKRLSKENTHAPDAR